MDPVADELKKLQQELASERAERASEKQRIADIEKRAAYYDEHMRARAPLDSLVRKSEHARRGEFEVFLVVFPAGNKVSELRGPACEFMQGLLQDYDGTKSEMESFSRSNRFLASLFGRPPSPASLPPSPENTAASGSVCFLDVCRRLPSTSSHR
jgi:hypothetical protein